MRQASDHSSCKVQLGRESAFAVALPWGWYRFGGKLALLSFTASSLLAQGHQDDIPQESASSLGWHREQSPGLEQLPELRFSSPGPVGHNPAVHICRRAIQAIPQLLSGGL